MLSINILDLEAGNVAHAQQGRSIREDDSGRGRCDVNLSIRRWKNINIGAFTGLEDFELIERGTPEEFPAEGCTTELAEY